MAVGIGIAAGGGGAYAVFASSNQAGTAILLILSAIFMLIGIQGTSLIRFSTGSNTVELERRRRTVEQAVKEIAKEEPERAAGIIEGAELANPPLGNAAPDLAMTLRIAIYGAKLNKAISEMGYTVSDASSSGAGSHLFVTDENNRTVSVEIAYRVHARLTRTWLDRIAQSHPETNPLLVVTNAPVPAPASAWATEMNRDAPVRLISWQPEYGNKHLSDSLAELFSSIPPK